MTNPNECTVCDTGGKCPTGEKRAVKYCPSCRLKLNPKTAKICPQCGLNLMDWLWEENARLREQRDFATWLQEMTQRMLDAMKAKRQRVAQAATHFWRDRDSWMQQAEARTQDGADVAEWNRGLQLELDRLREFCDAVHREITENAGGGTPFAYLWQSRWEQIKAAEKGTP